MKSLRESILTSIGQGDKYFDDLLKKYELDPKKVIWNKDGSIDYDGSISFHNMFITKIPVKFNRVRGDFSCSSCKNLLSLENCPNVVDGAFNCSNCKKIKSLKDCPKQVGGHFDCDNCRGLISLEGSPEKLKGDFYCIRCIKITSLKGCPKQVGNDFICYDCGRKFTEEEVREYCKVKNDIYV